MSGPISEDDSGFGNSSNGSELNYTAGLGRISGKLLHANLRRNGIDLTFRNSSVDPDLLYLDVTNGRVGINPFVGVSDLGVTHNLRIKGITNSTNVIVDNVDAKINNVVIQTGSSFTTLVGALNIVPTGGPGVAIISHERVITDGLEFNDNYIKGRVLDENIEFRPNGTGDTVVNASSRVFGDVDVTGNILAQTDVNISGYLQLGDNIIDTLTVNPDFSQSIIPGDDDLYDLGTALKKWRRIYVRDNDPVDSFISTTVTVSDQIYMFSNQITTLQSNDNLFLTSSEGTVVLEDISIKNNTITNLLDSVVTLVHTGNGYLEIGGTFGFQVPAGTTAERVGNAVGDTRWNTELDYLECFDGSVWQVSTGGGATVTTAFMEDLGHQYTLIFG